MIRILQISDIHWQCMDEELDKFCNFRKMFLRDIEDYKKQKNVKFDCMLVCGDIAFSGEEKQYEEAAEFLSKTCNIIGCDKSKVYIVPGNHDKNCQTEGKIDREALHHQLSDPAIGEMLFQKLKKESFGHIQSLYAPFSAYNEFVQQFNGLETMMEKCLNPANKDNRTDFGEKMYSVFTIGTENGYDIKLWGINTCLVSDLYDYRIKNGKEVGQRLLLPKSAYRIPAVDVNQIAISMMHHPKECLLNGDEVEEYLDECCKVQLFGHAHKPYFEHGNCVKIFSGALQPPEVGEGYYPVYNIITLEIDQDKDGSDILRTTVETQKWTAHRFQTANPNDKPIEVKLCEKSRFAVNKECIEDYTNGATKSDIYTMVFDYNDLEDVMETLCPGVYDQDSSDRTNKVNLMEWVEHNNKWVELWSMIRDDDKD